MYKKYTLPNNEKGRKLLEKIKNTNNTIIISRNSYTFKVKIKIKEKNT